MPTILNIAPALVRRDAPNFTRQSKVNGLSGCSFLHAAAHPTESGQFRNVSKREIVSGWDSYCTPGDEGPHNPFAGRRRRQGIGTRPQVTRGKYRQGLVWESMASCSHLGETNAKLQSRQRC
jgi:hypothetical protein